MHNAALADVYPMIQGDTRVQQAISPNAAALPHHRMRTQTRARPNMHIGFNHTMRTDGYAVGQLRGRMNDGCGVNTRRQLLQAVLIEPLSQQDRKSTRLNSSHVAISYAVFCLKKKKRSES